MQFILNPIIKNGLFLFFVLLLIVSLVLTFRQKVYHESVLAKTSTNLSGYFDERISRATSFFNLNQDNRVLQLENAELRKELEMLKGEISEADTAKRSISNLEFHQTYQFIPAEVINNSIVKSHNMITINKGSRHGIEKGMGIISSRGVVGYVYNTSENYSRIMSTLNKNTRINARIKGNEFFGTITWDGKDARFVQLTEIPKYIKVEKGDTIETDGKSPKIPGGIMIGTVQSAQIDEISGELDIEVRLRENFGKLRYAQVVVNLEKEEIMKVERDSIMPNAQP
ncbi:MAG: rod shape-determining protein MreC [Moheibacter sp.]